MGVTYIRTTKLPHDILKEQPSHYTKHDQLFKRLLESFFEEFIEAFFPEIHKQIDFDTISFL